MNVELKSIESIESEYDGYFVYMDNCQFNEIGTVIAGRVLYVEKDKAVFYERIKHIDVSTTTFVLPLTPNGKGWNLSI